MAKIVISRPYAGGSDVYLYGSQRGHSSFVTLSIHTGTCGDHSATLGDTGDDTGFKGAHDSKMKRRHHLYNKKKHSFAREDEIDPETGEYKIGEYLGTELVDAPELEKHDGCEVVEVAMSFEQFAEMLTSTGHQVDCTIKCLRGGIGDAGELYQEDVVPPPNIYDRAKRRIGKAQKACVEEMDAALAEIDDWKCTQKVKDAARGRITMARQHLIENMGYVVQQATEEMSAMAESAATIIYEKVARLEAEGRLPAGSLDQFQRGGAAALLGPGTPMETRRKLHDVTCSCCGELHQQPYTDDFVYCPTCRDECSHYADEDDPSTCSNCGWPMDEKSALWRERAAAGER